MSEEQKDQWINFGAFMYDAIKISNILGVPAKNVEEIMEHKDSQEMMLYRRGLDRADYILDMKLFEMAQSGDLKAFDKFNHRRKLRRG